MLECVPRGVMHALILQEKRFLERFWSHFSMAGAERTEYQQ
jgi:hypothetical protein